MTIRGGWKLIQVRVRRRTVELWGFCYHNCRYRSLFNAVCVFQAATDTFFVEIPENLSRTLHVVAGSSSLSHSNTFLLTLCKFFPFLSYREWPPFGEHEPLSFSCSLPVIAAVGRSICVLNTNSTHWLLPTRCKLCQTTIHASLQVCVRVLSRLDRRRSVKDVLNCWCVLPFMTWMLKCERLERNCASVAPFTVGCDVKVTL